MIEVVIGFSKPRGKIFPIFSWLIRLYEGTKYSHTYIKVRTEHGLEVYHSSGTHVNCIGEAWYLRTIDVVKEFSVMVSEEEYKSGMRFVKSNLGKPYSLSEVTGIVISDALGKKRNVFSNGERSFFCSELVTLFIRKIGLDPKFIPDRARLKDLFNLMQSIENLGAK